MTSDRAKAYGRVMATIDEVGATKLQPSEIERIRTAADTLLFAEEAPSQVIDDIRELTRHLAETGRWLDERALRLLDDVESCGPLARTR